ELSSFLLQWKRAGPAGSALFRWAGSAGCRTVQVGAHMRAQRGEGAGCFGVVGGKIQQLEDVPLFPYGAKAFGVNQLKHKRGMPDRMVGRVLLQAAQHGVVLVKSVDNRRRDRALAQRFT